MTENPIPLKMREKLDFAVSEMRRVINDLHPSVLETMGFKPALENLLSILARETNIDCNFEDGDGQSDYNIAAFTKLQLYRIVQETLNNVEKHAKASQVRLFIKKTLGDLEIRVADNGKGIDPRLARKDSHGLLNVRQRAQLIGAQVEWKKPDDFDSGTEVKLRIHIGEDVEPKSG